MLHHLPPGRPVVRHVVSPEVEIVRNAFLRQHAGEAAGSARVFVSALPRDYVNLALLAKQVEVVIAHVRQVIHRVVEVDVLVEVIAVIITANVERAAHRDHPVEEVGPAKQLIGAVERAEARARGDYARAAPAAVPDVRHDLARYVAVVLDLPRGFVFRMNLVIEPARPVDAVDREDLYFSRLDKILDRVDHLKPLVLQVVGRRGGKHEQGESEVPVGDYLHSPVEARAVPLIGNSVHEGSPWFAAASKLAGPSRGIILHLWEGGISNNS